MTLGPFLYRFTEVTRRDPQVIPKLLWAGPVSSLARGDEERPWTVWNLMHLSTMLTFEYQPRHFFSQDSVFLHSSPALSLFLFSKEQGLCLSPSKSLLVPCLRCWLTWDMARLLQWWLGRYASAPTELFFNYLDNSYFILQISSIFVWSRFYFSIFFIEL